MELLPSDRLKASHQDVKPSAPILESRLGTFELVYMNPMYDIDQLPHANTIHFTFDFSDIIELQQLM